MQTLRKVNHFYVLIDMFLSAYVSLSTSTHINNFKIFLLLSELSRRNVYLRRYLMVLKFHIIYRKLISLFESFHNYTICKCGKENALNFLKP